MPRSRSFTRLTMRVALLHFGQSVDFVVLGLGTSLFGTIDGKYTEAAGFVGVQVPPHADVAQYQKLIEMRYTPAWIRWGNLGDHTGAPAMADHVDHHRVVLKHPVPAAATVDTACPPGG